MKNKLALLGFLSLLGFLGIFSDNQYFVAFFAYAVFFRYWNIIPDELFQTYVEKAGSRAFFAGIGIHLVSTLVAAFFFHVNDAAIIGSTISSTAALLVFTFTLSHYENLEKKGCQP